MSDTQGPPVTLEQFLESAPKDSWTMIPLDHGGLTAVAVKGKDGAQAVVCVTMDVLVSMAHLAMSAYLHHRAMQMQNMRTAQPGGGLVVPDSGLILPSSGGGQGN